MITATEKADHIGRMAPEDRKLAETYRGKSLLVIPESVVCDACSGIELEADECSTTESDGLHRITQMLAVEGDGDAIPVLDGLLDARERNGYLQTTMRYAHWCLDDRAAAVERLQTVLKLAVSG